MEEEVARGNTSFEGKTTREIADSCDPRLLCKTDETDPIKPSSNESSNKADIESRIERFKGMLP